MNNLRDTFLELRGSFDASSPFMRGGHQIMKTQQRKKDIPSWIKHVSEFRTLLLRSFPKMKTDARQRAQAGRWARICLLHFRLSYTHKEIAAELGMTAGSIRRMLVSIRRAARGYRANGSGKRSQRPPGRPRKVSNVRP